MSQDRREEKFERNDERREERKSQERRTYERPMGKREETLFVKGFDDKTR